MSVCPFREISVWSFMGRSRSTTKVPSSPGPNEMVPLMRSDCSALILASPPRAAMYLAMTLSAVCAASVSGDSATATKMRNLLMKEVPVRRAAQRSNEMVEGLPMAVNGGSPVPPFHVWKKHRLILPGECVGPRCGCKDLRAIFRAKEVQPLILANVFAVHEDR